MPPAGTYSARSDASRAAVVLRGLLLAGLGAAALLVPGRDGEGGGTLTLGADYGAALAAALVAARPPARIVWSDVDGPGGRALWLLSAGPAVPPLVLPVGTPQRLRAYPPERPTAGRASALSAALDGPAGDTAWIRWRDLLGADDSLRVVLGPDGRATAGLRVRPARPGWHAWTVVTGGDSTGVGAWVAPERPIRALALAGAPDWEARFALRALDEAGVDVDARFELGRVDIGTSGVGIGTLDLEPYDVVLLLGGARPSLEVVGSLVEFARRGGGVLIAPAPAGGGLAASPGDVAAPPGDVAAPPGDVAAPPGPPDGRSSTHVLLSSLGLADSLSVGPTLEVGGALAWALPAELSPLPPAPTRAATLALAVVDGARVVARGPDGSPVAVVRAVGRGRAAVAGLPETWRWRMEGGATDAHRAWWRAWAAWAASGVRGPLLVSAPEHPVPAGSVVRVGVEELDPGVALPPSLRLERPDGRVEELPTVALTAGRGEARFLADAPGPHRLSWAGGETGVLATETPPPPDPAERSLVALASGSGLGRGEPLPPAGGRVARGRGAIGRGAGVAGRAPDAVVDADGPWRDAGRPGLPLVLGALLAALALAEWTVRRLRAGP
jgi:hypothetical protein